MNTLRRAGWLLIALLLPAAAADAQTATAEDVATALRAQTDHYASVARRGKQKFYTPHFDLSGLPSYRPERLIEGWIRVGGDNYLADGELGEIWRRGFAKFQPGLHVTYFLPTSAAAFGLLYSGMTDIAVEHEPGFYDMLAYERIMNRDPLTLTALTGSFDVSGWSNSFAILVNDQNPLSRITIDQLDGIFGSARDGGWKGTNWRTSSARGPEKDIRTWGQMGLTGEWADQPITPYGFSLRYNTSTIFSDKVMEGGDKWNERLHAYANYMKPDGTRSIEADEIMEHVRHDKWGIAYLLFRGDKPGAKRLAVAARGSHTYVTGTVDTVQNHTYPLFNELWLYLNMPQTGALDPKLKEFCRYILSREGQEAVQEDGKYLPITAEVAKAQLAKLDAL
jgi:phosphate transport system substrate-binding protein